jgi:hypothetical protein
LVPCGERGTNSDLALPHAGEGEGRAFLIAKSPRVEDRNMRRVFRWRKEMDTPYAIFVWAVLLAVIYAHWPNSQNE